MKRIYILPILATSFILAACGPQVISTPTQPPVTGQPTLDVTEQPTLMFTEEPSPIPTNTAPSQVSTANAPSPAWTEIRESRFGFGIALPCWWQYTPMPAEGYISSMTIRNYDDVFFAANSERGMWKNGIAPNGVISMDVTAITGVDPNLTMVDSYMQYVDPANYALASSEERQIGRHWFTLITLQNLINTSEPNSTIHVTALSPDTILVFNVYPMDAVNSSDVQAILASFAGVVDEPVNIPATDPSPALIPQTCAQ